jgi:hypothetical protein
MYQRYYGEPELARLTFAGLPEEVKRRLKEVDYSQAEQVARTDWQSLSSCARPLSCWHRPAKR